VGGGLVVFSGVLWLWGGCVWGVGLGGGFVGWGGFFLGWVFFFCFGVVGLLFVLGVFLGGGGGVYTNSNGKREEGVSNRQRIGARQEAESPLRLHRD